MSARVAANKETRINFSKPLWRGWGEGASRDVWIPPTDVYAVGSGWIVKMDLAGVNPEDVTCEAIGNELHVFGTRRDLISQRGVSQCYLEISYTQFERVIEFPENIDQAKMTADYLQGMFLIRIER